MKRKVSPALVITWLLCALAIILSIQAGAWAYAVGALLGALLYSVAS